jgi:hypothetical protein
MYETYFNSRSDLSSKFEQLKKNIELTESQKRRIIGSHIHLRENHLQRLPFVSKSFLTGSYKKNTMIKPPNDVDIFVLITEDHLKVSPNSTLNKLKKYLIESYPNSIIKRDKPCVVLDFKHCKFEITPAIPYYYNDRFFIPEIGGNQWEDVENPRILEKNLSNANKRVNGMLTPLIKMMKVCKRFNKIKNVKSCEIEKTAINNIYHLSSYRNGVQQMLQALNWNARNHSHYNIEQMNDSKFSDYCRNTLFGNQFPA